MHIIVKSKKDYQKFFSISKSNEDVIYTAGNFLLQQELMNGTLLCNTLTGELVLLSSEEKDLFDALPMPYRPELSELISHRFIVPEGCLEVRSVEQLRALLVRRKETRKVITQYNILPTTFCNARCFYCYESNIKHVHMSEETADQLVKFIAANHGDSEVKLSWFGGEPTVGRIRIDQICEGLRKMGIEFYSTMVSNAYLFDANLVKHAKNDWKLKSIQITLDGTESVYIQSKSYIGIQDNPYQRVLQNIQYFVDEGIYVKLRLNLDCHNIEDLKVLIDELSDRYINRKHIEIYIRQLDEGAGFEPIEHTQEDLDALKNQLIFLQNRLEHKNWSQCREFSLPSLRISSCMADTSFFIQCTPDGILSKCENQIYNHTIGTLSEGITNQEEIRWWRERTIYEGCAKCPIYPSCSFLLKNCPVKKGKCTEHYRIHRIARYKEIMFQEYEKWKA